jgi:hypothetical protein
VAANVGRAVQLLTVDAALLGGFLLRKSLLKGTVE